MGAVIVEWQCPVTFTGQEPHGHRLEVGDDPAPVTGALYVRCPLDTSRAAGPVSVIIDEERYAAYWHPGKTPEQVEQVLRSRGVTSLNGAELVPMEAP